MTPTGARCTLRHGDEEVTRADDLRRRPGRRHLPGDRADHRRDGRLPRFPRAGVTVGKDAQGEVNVEVEHDGQVYRGRGVSTDSVEASGKAFLNAINRVAIQTAPRLHPQHSVAE